MKQNKHQKQVKSWVDGYFIGYKCSKYSIKRIESSTNKGARKKVQKLRLT